MTLADRPSVRPCLSCGYLLHPGCGDVCTECGRAVSIAGLREETLRVARNPLSLLVGVLRGRGPAGWWWSVREDGDAHRCRRRSAVALCVAVLLTTAGVVLWNSVRAEVTLLGYVVAIAPDGSIARFPDGAEAKFHLTSETVRYAGGRSADRTFWHDNRKLFPRPTGAGIAAQKETTRQLVWQIDRRSLAGLHWWVGLVMGLWAGGCLVTLGLARCIRGLTAEERVAVHCGAWLSAVVAPLIALAVAVSAGVDVCLRRLWADTQSAGPRWLTAVSVAIPVLVAAACWVALLRSDRTGRLLRAWLPRRS